MSKIDFETFKASLLTALSNDPTFSGYNAAGRGLSVLVDLLSKDAEIIAMYLNMANTESNLSTATLPQSIISHISKHYAPRVFSADEAVLEIKVPINDVLAEGGHIKPGDKVVFNGLSFWFTSYSAPVSTDGTYYTFKARAFSGNLQKYSFNISDDNFERFIVERKFVDIESLEAFLEDEKQNVPSKESYIGKQSLDIDSLLNGYKIQWTTSLLPELVFMTRPTSNKILTVYAVSSPDESNFKSSANNTGIFSNAIISGTVIAKKAQMTLEQLRTHAMLSRSSEQLIELDSYKDAIFERFNIKHAKVFRTANRPGSVTIVVYDGVSDLTDANTANAIKVFLEQRNAGSEVIVKKPEVWKIALSVSYVDENSPMVIEDVAYITSYGNLLLDSNSNGNGLDVFKTSNIVCSRSNISSAMIESISIDRIAKDRLSFSFLFETCKLTNLKYDNFTIAEVANVGSKLLADINGITVQIGSIDRGNINLFKGYELSLESTVTLTNITSDVIIGKNDTIFAISVA